MKRFSMFVLSAILCVGSLFAQDAAAYSAVAVMQAAKDHIQADTISRRSRMVISARNGSATERSIDQYSKDGADGYARAVIVFQSPATVRGTRFLTMDNASGKSDQWIFLPALVSSLYLNCGYRRLSLIRASAVVNRQLILQASLLRLLFHASASFRICSIVGTLADNP